MKRIIVLIIALALVAVTAVVVSVTLIGSGNIGDVSSWSVTEECTPVSVGDSSGSVGSLSLSAAATPTSIFAASNQISLTSGSGTWDGQVTSAPVSGLGVTLDAAGELAFLNAIRTAPACGNFTEYVGEFGTTGSGDGQMTNVGDVVFDSAGNIFVADRANYRIQKFVPDGNGGYTYSAKVGSAGTGNGQFGTVMPTGLMTVGFLAVDSSDRIYATDPANNRVQRFTNGLVYSTQFGTAGAGNGQYSIPLGIAIDSSDNVFIGEAGNGGRIQKLDSSYTYVTKWAVPGAPYGMDTDAAGNVYAALSALGTNIVQKYSTSGVAGDVTAAGTFAAALATPYGVAVDSSGYVYATDFGNNRVQKFDINLDHVGSFGSFGNGPSEFKDPRGIAVSSAGLIAVADFTNNRVQTFTSPGENRILLSEAYQRYIDLCDTESRTFTYTATSDPLVVYPGWTDKVWNKLKQLGAATHTEVSYTGGAIVVGDIGTRTLAITNRTVPRVTPNVQGAARSIELIDNNIEAGDGLLMYTADVTYRVDVGKTETLIVSTENSPTVVNNPIPVDGTIGAGQYRVVDSLGVAVTAASWIAAGGLVTAEAGAGTGQIVITFTGPSSTIGGTTAPYSFAYDGDPQLSITGSGVTTDRQVFSMHTGAAEDKITRDVASAEYSPFLSGTEQMYDRGMWFAVESMAGVEFSCTIPLDSSKAFGEYQGCIIEHDNCKYRVTRAVIGNLSVQLTAQWHVTVGDVDAVWSGLTVGDVDADWLGFELGDELIKPLLLP